MPQPSKVVPLPLHINQVRLLYCALTNILLLAPCTLWYKLGEAKLSHWNFFSEIEILISLTIILIVILSSHYDHLLNYMDGLEWWDYNLGALGLKSSALYNHIAKHLLHTFWKVNLVYILHFKMSFPAK